MLQGVTALRGVRGRLEYYLAPCAASAQMEVVRQWDTVLQDARGSAVSVWTAAEVATGLQWAEAMEQVLAGVVAREVRNICAMFFLLFSFSPPSLHLFTSASVAYTQDPF